MKVNIHAPFEVNAGLKQLIQDKVNKLHTYYERILKADIYLKLREDNVRDGKMVEINLHVPLKDIFAKDTEDTYEKAIAKTTKKLETQLKRRKEILAKKH